MLKLPNVVLIEGEVEREWGRKKASLINSFILLFVWMEKVNLLLLSGVAATGWEDCLYNIGSELHLK